MSAAIPQLSRSRAASYNFLVLWHWSDNAFLEPGWQGLDRLASCCGLGVDVKDVRGASRAIAFGESGDCAIVQQLDSLDWSVDAVTVADSEARKAFVLLIPQRYFLPSFFLKLLELLVKVSDGLRILILLLVMDSVSLMDGLYELLSEVAEPGWVVDVKSLDDVSGRGRGDGVDVRGRHGDGGRGTGRAVGRHRDVSVWRAEWKGVG